MEQLRRAAELEASERDDPADAADLAVVRRAQQDRRAFEPLYRKYLTRVFHRCRAVSPDDETAWDATAQTFAKALAGLAGFDADAVAFAPWLFRIAENCCRDLARARLRRPTVPIPEGLDIPDDAPDPEAEALAADDRRRLEAALRRLAPRRERVIRLRLDGLSGKEIAARLGISHDLVRKEQERAIDDLGVLLGTDAEREEERHARHG
jgi:RNA polymerase sigma-70 factor (ECF subfamily)